MALCATYYNETVMVTIRELTQTASEAHVHTNHLQHLRAINALTLVLSVCQCVCNGCDVR